MSDQPQTDDEDALRQISQSGSDMMQPMDVDIHIAVPDEEAAIEIANLAGTLGYRTEIYFDDDVEDVENVAEPWTCQCSRVMIVNLESITETQTELNRIAEPRGGYVDGWGTYGNG